jgi:hypothetical protein
MGLGAHWARAAVVRSWQASLSERHTMQDDTHPAAPEQTEHGFDEGAGRRPRPRPQRRVGRFSDGIAAEDSERERRRFSEGIEQSPEAPDSAAERRFSEGIERGRPPRRVPD